MLNTTGSWPPSQSFRAPVGPADENALRPDPHPGSRHGCVPVTGLPGRPESDEPPESAPNANDPPLRECLRCTGRLAARTRRRGRRRAPDKCGAWPGKGADQRRRRADRRAAHARQDGTGGHRPAPPPMALSATGPASQPTNSTARCGPNEAHPHCPQPPPRHGRRWDRQHATHGPATQQ
jgi:hypothetical protein